MALNPCRVDAKPDNLTMWMCSNSACTNNSAYFTEADWNAAQLPETPLIAALHKIASYPRGGMITQGTDMFDRDAMIGTAREALSAWYGRPWSMLP